MMKNKTLQLLLTLVWLSTGTTTNTVHSDETTLGRVPGTGVMSGSVSGPNKFIAAKVYAKNLDKNIIKEIQNKQEKILISCIKEYSY